MSKQPARSTIGKDPFADVIQDRLGEEAEVIQHPTARRVVEAHRDETDDKKEKMTVHLTHDLINRVKNAAYWDPEHTITSIAEIGMKYAIEKVEREHGGPYPQRKHELKGGRPIGS